MKRTLTCLALFSFAISASPSQQPCEQPWHFAVGVQMPSGSGPSLGKVTLYFKPPAPVKPSCKVTFSAREAAVIDEEIGYVIVAARPGTRVDIACTLPEGKPQ